MFQFFSHTPALSAKEISKKITDQGVCFIDVRSTEEYADGHAKHAVNIPLDELVDRMSELSGYKEVYVICRSGGRSAQAVDYLIAHEVNAVNVSGGTLSWESAGLPME